MTTISSTDIEGESKKGLDDHLKNEDFFDVENHPTAMVSISSAEEVVSPEYTFTGEMTILGVSNPITFTGIVSDLEDSLQLDSAFTINKDDYGIGSGFKGAAIKDELEFDISAIFSK